MSSSIESIWADMKKESDVSTQTKTTKIGFVSEHACNSSQDKEKKSKKGSSGSNLSSDKNKKKKGNKTNHKSETTEKRVTKSEILAGLRTPSQLPPDTLTVAVKEEDIPELKMSGEELVMRLQRPIQQTKDESLNVRRSALQLIHDLICIKLKDKLDDKTMTLLLDELSKAILKRFADCGGEKIRELAVDIMTYLISRCLNLIGLLPYLYPVVMDRLGHQHGYDTETNIFIHDVELHKAWKRGAAISRQDQADNGVEGAIVVKVIEPSEEIRLKLLKLMATLVITVVKRNNSNLLHPYFHDTILFIQAHLRDPYPEIKLEACKCLEFLARSTSLNQGMIYYALATARAILPSLRHRHAKVRAAAVRSFTAAVAVPFKAKCRGAGTDAIVDLIGYNAEDTIPIAAFYGNHTCVNYLAELCVDPVSSVRLETAKMLGEFIVSLPDRYDHRTRLVPFLLNAVNDQESTVCDIAMKALSIAGAEYEKENQEDVIERRQYGVDGDRRSVHHGLVLPFPFKERPRLGERLYVRGCTRRFLKPLLNELTDWKGKTKLSSARLLRTVIVYSEEALTQDLNVLVPELCAAFKVIEGNKDDKDVYLILCQCCELLGRFIAPDSYVPFLLPRLKGELAVLPGGIDGTGRALVLLLAKWFMRGSSPKELVKHAEELSGALTDEFVITSGIPELKSRALDACDSLVKALLNSGASLEAHYLASGRLAHKTKLLQSLIQGLLVWRHDARLTNSANTALARLACVEARDDAEAKKRVEKFYELHLALNTGSGSEVSSLSTAYTATDGGNKQLLTSTSTNSTTPNATTMATELKNVEWWLVTWLISKFSDSLSSTVCELYPLDVMWETNEVNHIIIVQLMTLVCDVPAMVLLMEKLDHMFNPHRMKEEKNTQSHLLELFKMKLFRKEWANILLETCSKLRIQCDGKDDKEGRLQHAVLSLYRRLCFNYKVSIHETIKKGNNNMPSSSNSISSGKINSQSQTGEDSVLSDDIWHMNSIAEFLLLCDSKNWNDHLRAKTDGIKCASILLTYLSPSIPVQSRLKSCSSLKYLLQMGLKRNSDGRMVRLKSFKKMHSSFMLEEFNATNNVVIKNDWLEIACMVCNPLVCMLEDPMDSIRIEVASNALQTLLYFVSPFGTFKVKNMSTIPLLSLEKELRNSEEKREVDSIDDDWDRINLSDVADATNEMLGNNIDDGLIHVAVVDYISFRELLHAIIPLLILNNSTDNSTDPWKPSTADNEQDVEEKEDQFIEALDLLLRQLAILDPFLFQQCLTDYTLVGRLGELDTHAELLINLEKAKQLNHEVSSQEESYATVTSVAMGVHDLELD